MKGFIKPEKRKGVVIIAIITLIIIAFLLLMGNFSYDRDSYIIGFLLVILAGCSACLYGFYPLIGAVTGGITGAILEQVLLRRLHAVPNDPNCLPPLCVYSRPHDPPPYMLILAIAGWLVWFVIAIIVEQIKEKRQKNIDLV